ncbi:MAG: hypothetical protein AMXMBFR56_82650 [Polyangiaceae bacterium]
MPIEADVGFGTPTVATTRGQLAGGSRLVCADKGLTLCAVREDDDPFDQVSAIRFAPEALSSVFSVALVRVAPSRSEESAVFSPAQLLGGGIVSGVLGFCHTFEASSSSAAFSHPATESAPAAALPPLAISDGALAAMDAEAREHDARVEALDELDNDAWSFARDDV